jgi:hypothetical protein
MADKIIAVPTEEIARTVANYTIGFANIVVEDNAEIALGAGSGTFVKLGSVFGIATAAHVISHLPACGTLGLVRYTRDQFRFERQSFQYDADTALTIRAEEFSVQGPDLGFFRLYDDTLGWVRAINSFVDLQVHRYESLKGTVEGPATFAIVGMIDGMTQLVDLAERRRAAHFTAIFTNGDLAGSNHAPDDPAIVTFEPTSYPDFALPNDFRGTSGGGLWRVGIDNSNPDHVIVAGAKFWGIPFFQTPRDGRPPALACHGPEGVYVQLYNAIANKWPKDIG